MAASNGWMVWSEKGGAGKTSRTGASARVARHDLLDRGRDTQVLRRKRADPPMRTSSRPPEAQVVATRGLPLRSVTKAGHFRHGAPRRTSLWRTPSLPAPGHPKSLDSGQLHDAGESQHYRSCEEMRERSLSRKRVRTAEFRKSGPPSRSHNYVFATVAGLAVVDTLLCEPDSTEADRFEQRLTDAGQDCTTQGKCRHLNSPMLATVWPNLANVWPTPAKIIQMQVRIGQHRSRTQQRVGPIWPTSAELLTNIDQHCSKFPGGPGWLLIGQICGPHRLILAEYEPNLDSRSNRSITVGPATVANTEFCDHGSGLNRRKSRGAHPVSPPLRRLSVPLGANLSLPSGRAWTVFWPPPAADLRPLGL